MKFSMAQAKDDSLSFWTLRKQRAHAARNASQSYIGYLQNMLSESGIQYDSFTTFKGYCSNAHPLNLERYSEYSETVGNITKTGRKETTKSNQG